MMRGSMKRVLKILGGVVGVLAVAAVVVYFTMVAATYGPRDCDAEIRLDLATLRELAGALPGERPGEIRVEEVGGGPIPKALAVPGTSWREVGLRVYAYQLVFPDQTIVVDAAMSKAQAEDLGMTDGYDDAAWARLSDGMEKASAIYVTHEHADHMGGAVADARWAANLRLTTPQLDSTVMSRPEIPEAVRSAAKRIELDGNQAVAPGVVLIPARGHTPGSLMVYVSRADGSEVLLTGDNAWLAESIDRRQGPPKFATWLMGSDRSAQACWLRALDEVQKSDPAIAIMPGHDSDRMNALVEKGVFTRGFK